MTTIRRSFQAVVVTLVGGALAALGGCQEQQRSTKVPQESISVAKVQQAPVTWMADRTGTLYVVDVPDDTVVYQGTIRTGQTVTVDPQVRRITIDGREVPEGEKIKSGHRHELYLKTGAVIPDGPDRGERVGERQ